VSDQESKSLAMRIAAYCVRLSIIEQYHQEGKLSDEEMKAFNKEVVNRLYTFFKYANSELPEERTATAEILYAHHPRNWDEPVLDPLFVNSVQSVMKAPISSHTLEAR
jgi:hypothetical protein